ncbi:uncharacterized protein LOC133896859 [Phragmites australis]|uniref:uncharacterized protein LOC133896859 n=1 Tax=Phragmites australis TaxID=29695 RepID=UPI002D795CBD|nr:uncharacterized protein LOC133896859 [Phragmites australis]
MIPAEYQGHWAFTELFVFRHEGTLPIPCDVKVFEGILWLMQGRKKEAAMHDQAAMDVSLDYKPGDTQQIASAPVLNLVQQQSGPPQVAVQAVEGLKVEGAQTSQMSGQKFKLFCSRCSRRGHLVAECPMPLFCEICESKTHVTHKCPLLKATKPVAHSVGYGVKGLGFFHIPVPEKEMRKNKSEVAWALASVKGGSMSVPQVIAELERLVPVKWAWEVKEQGIDAFLIAFPNEVERHRMVEFGILTVKYPAGVQLQFDEWGADDEAKFQLPMIWVQVGGIPKELRTFPILWSVGTVLGATQKVDMVFTRNNDMARILIAVLDPSLIPDTLEVVFGSCLYSIYFMVEKGDSVTAGGRGVNGDGNDRMDDDEEDDLLDEDDVMEDRGPKRSKNASAKLSLPSKSLSAEEGEGASSGNKSTAAISLPLEQSGAGNLVLSSRLLSAQEEIVATAGNTIVTASSLPLEKSECSLFPASSALVPILEAAGCFDLNVSKDRKPGTLCFDEWVRNKVDAIMDIVVDANLKEIADRIVAEDADFGFGKTDMLPIGSDLGKGAGTEDAAAASLPLAATKDQFSSVSPGASTPSKRVSSNTPVRWSKRRASTVDEDSVERAARLVAIRNLEIPDTEETHRNDFVQTDLNHFCGDRDFGWHWSSPRGRSGGILMGVNLSLFEVIDIFEGEFHVKFHLKCKDDGFQWILMAVYGAAQPEYKELFLTELVHACSNLTLPIMVGGDFNIIRSPVEKSNDKYDDRWPFLFNAIIESLDLREIVLSGRQFTWANSLENPTYEKLDRILVSTEWEQKYPLCTVQALSRDISDHTPLLLDSRDASHRDVLDRKAEKILLSPEESDMLRCFKASLAQLLREEEIAWFQRSKTKQLFEGDRNSRYFQLIANGKYRKTRIFQIEHDGRTFTRQDEIKEHITSYYRDLFGPPVSNQFLMLENRKVDIPQISDIENDMLVEGFSEKEVKEAIYGMEHNKAPGPDGFPAEFYQVFWEVIKADLMALFDDFHEGDLPLFRLNFGIITLLPKVKDAAIIQQYRPICLLNVSFKIFTKVATNRIVEVSEKIIRPSQTTFLPGRNILEGVAILHETIHEMHRKKLSGVILKLDFEKAYDKVKWPFLQQTLRMKGFSPVWCSWIEQFVTGGSVAVKVNNDIGRYFQTKKGLRQGDPISPILFNIVVDMLAVLIGRAKDAGQIRGVVPHLIDDGLSILQYADDTVLFMEHDIDQAKNMKLLLCAFEELSGLKINFHKSELFCYGDAKESVEEYSHLFGCEMGNYPFRYLGIPMHHRKLSNKDWRIIEDRFQKKLSSWKGKLLTIGGRLVLINSNLSSIVMYMLSFFEIPRGILKNLDYFRSRFFWQSTEHKKKYRLVKWGILCRPKDQGGLGIKNIDVQNKCLLSKWLFKLINEDGMWQQLLRRKYLKNKTIGEVKWKPGDSHFWSGLMKVKDQFLRLGSFHLNNGFQIRFWEDTWVIFRGTHWIRQWSLLQEEEARQQMKWACRILETTIMEIFVKHGWMFTRRIGP